MNACRRITHVIPILLTLASLGLAQDFRATLQGQITDPSGAAIAGASVKAIHVETNEVKETQTNSEGRYALPYLDPGTYTVSVQAGGFQSLRRDQIVLRVADKFELPLKLALGQISQTMEVTADQDVLETGSADRGLSFDPVKAQELPLNGRQEYMLMDLTPGVLFTQEIFGNGSGAYSGTRGWDVSNAYKINGARPGLNNFYLNGAPISDNSGTWQLSPNIEAVQEFKVMLNTYDAQYGGFGGGAVNTTIRSGGNAYHGDVFDYARNAYFDANNFQNNYNGQPTPYHNQQQFGGVFGGPVIKDKDYFFVSFEGWREILPTPAQSSVPTAAMRTGDFATNGISIYDPLTSAACSSAAGLCSGNHQFLRSPFPGNIIPNSRISPIAQKILAFVPMPTTGGVQNNFNAPNTRDQYGYNQPIGRFDHNFTQNTRLSAMFTFQHGNENRASNGFAAPISYGNINNERTDHNEILDVTHVINSTTVFDARLSFGRFTNNQPGWGNPNFTGASLGINVPCPPTIVTCAAPAISFSSGGYANLFGNSNYIINWRSYNTWDFVPTLTKNHGAHTLHAGFEWKYAMRPSQSSGYASGLFSFSQAWTQKYSDQNQGSTDGSPIASLLLGYPASGQVDYNAQQYITRPLYAGYIQDDWKVSSRLTVNVGLRYEVQIPWKERYDRTIRGFDFNSVNPMSAAVVANWANLAQQYNATHTDNYGGYPAAPAALYGGLLFAGVNGVPNRAYSTDWTNLSPRIGIAYRIDEKTVIRTGAGVFYPQQTDYLPTQYGYSQTTSYNAANSDATQFPSSGASLTGPYSLANPFPNGILAPGGATLGMLSQVGSSISFNGPNYRTPRTYQYSFAVQRELPKRMDIEVAYSGNREIFVPIAYNVDNDPANQAQLNAAITDPNYLNHTVPNPFYGILPASTTLGANSTISYGNLIRNYPLFTGITQNYIQVGHYRSDMLQVKVEKRLLGSEKIGILTWNLAYTFGKQMQEDHRKDNYLTSEPLEWEIDDGTKIHSFSFSGVYDLPFGTGKAFLNSPKALVSNIVSNWRANFIVSYRSGYPVTWPALINKCGNWQAADQNENSWFNNNKSCYSTLPSFVLNPNLNRFSTIFNPAVPNVNAAIEKTFPIRERYKVLIRGEAFNLTNTPLRPGPDTNFSDAQFGQLPKTQNNFPRTLQLAAKFYF